MADAKIINYGQQISAGSTAIPDNNVSALDIESTEAKDFISISTAEGDESVRMVKTEHFAYGDTLTNTPKMTITPQSGQILFDTSAGSNTDFSFRPEGTEELRINSDGAGVDFPAGSATAPSIRFLTDTNTGIGRAAADQLSLIAGGQEGIRITESGDAITEVAVKGRAVITADTSGTPDDLSDYDNYVLVLQGSSDDNDETALLFSGSVDAYGGSAIVHKDTGSGGKGDLSFYTKQVDTQTPPTKVMTLTDTGSVQTIGSLGTALTSGTVSTSGSSTTLNGSGTVFTTDFHVGAAIKVGSVVTTVTAIASDTELTLQDAIDTSSTGTTCTRDSGELFAVKTGDSKTLFAVDAEGALVLNTSGSDSSSNNNIGIGGSNILTNATTGNRLIVIGHSSSDYDFTTADSMIVMGYDAGTKITGAARGVLIGPEAGLEVTTSNNIVCIGQKSGEHAGNDCTYIGRAAGQNTTSANNVAIGSSALSASGNPTNSVAVGKDAGKLATNYASTCVGYRAGQTLTGGQSCTLIGADASVGSFPNEDNQTVIGANAAAHGANTVVIGAATVTSIDSHSDQTVDLGTTAYEFDAVHCVSVTEVSDARLKEDITDTVMGLDFINSLRPVSYKFKDIERKTETVTYEAEKIVIDEDGNETVQVVTEEKEVVVHPGKTHNRKHQGLLAQEVKASLDAAGIDAADFGGFVDGNVVDGTDKMALRYNQFIGPLIKAVQELTARVEQLEGGN